MSKELIPCPMCESTDIDTYSYNADDHGMCWETYYKCKKCGRTALDYCWRELTKEEYLTVENRQLKAENEKLKCTLEKVKNHLVIHRDHSIQSCRQNGKTYQVINEFMERFCNGLLKLINTDTEKGGRG